MGARSAGRLVPAAVLLGGCAAVSIPGGSAVRTVPCIRAARAAPESAEPVWKLAPRDETRSPAASGEVVLRPVLLDLGSAVDPRSGEAELEYQGPVVSAGPGTGSVSRHPESVSRIVDDLLSVVWFTSHDQLGVEITNLGSGEIAVDWESSRLVDAGGSRHAILPALGCLVAAEEKPRDGPGRAAARASRAALAPGQTLRETILFDRRGEFRPRRPYDAFGMLVRIEAGGRSLDYTFQFAPPGADAFSWFPVGSDFPPFIPH